MFRKTGQRSIILSELESCSDHPSADQLHRMVRAMLPRISLATVYRNLELLVAQGRIQRLDSGVMSRRYDAVSAPHPHFLCIGCGRVEDAPIAGDVPELDPASRWVRRRRVLGSRLEYFGLCMECARKA